MENKNDFGLQDDDALETEQERQVPGLNSKSKLIRKGETYRNSSDKKLKSRSGDVSKSALKNQNKK